MAFAADPMARAVTNKAFMIANDMDVKTIPFANLTSFKRTKRLMPRDANKTRKNAICKGWISGPAPFSKVVCNHLVKNPLVLQRIDAMINKALAFDKPAEGSGSICLFVMNYLFSNRVGDCNSSEKPHTLHVASLLFDKLPWRAGYAFQHKALLQQHPIEPKLTSQHDGTKI